MIDSEIKLVLKNFLKSECMLDDVEESTSLFVSGLLDSLDFLDLLEFLKQQGLPEGKIETLEYSDLDDIQKIIVVLNSDY